jgi:ParB family chromosome partitioning protein
MAVRKSGLGRGLDALIPVDRPSAGFTTLAVDLISPNPQQPREHFDEEALESLAASIREVGVLQPVVVRQGRSEGHYVLVAGERRWRAARHAGLTEIPAMIRSGDDVSGLTEALIENVQREDLTPLEEAAAYRQLMEDFGLTHEEVGERVGKSRSAISNTLRLLQLPPPVQALLTRGALSAGHCRPLLALGDEREAVGLARRAAEEGWPVRRVEDEVRRALEVTGEAQVRAGAHPEAPRPAEVVELEEALAERLGTPVAIAIRAGGGGRLTIRFGSVDDLERIYRLVLEGD